ncbi:unnamed protein product [Brassica rapa]|uniref:Uncharacterized protein n=1 Tax=Brassica campestris TaxID=3711 RepID=A0A8D9HA05_BRACM|nr:unnamed protein product [Brassica rapa]
MEEMRQDYAVNRYQEMPRQMKINIDRCTQVPSIDWYQLARIQRATDVSCPTSIDRYRQASIDNRLHASIDNRLPASVDDNPPQLHTTKSKPDFHTIEEIDQLVEGIYRALETTEERLDMRCDDIYFPMDITISALTSKIEAIQQGLVEIQSYITRRPEASATR